MNQFRYLTLTAFLLCIALLGFAMYQQYIAFLDPCPLCVLQRAVYIGIAMLSVLAFVHNPSIFGKRVYAAVLTLIGFVGVGIAAWHIRLQHLPEDQVPDCGPGLDYMLESMPFTEVLKKVFAGSGECADVLWQLFGLSMPEWSIVMYSLFSLGFLAMTIWPINIIKRI